MQKKKNHDLLNPSMPLQVRILLERVIIPEGWGLLTACLFL